MYPPFFAQEEVISYKRKRAFLNLLFINKQDLLSFSGKTKLNLTTLTLQYKSSFIGKRDRLSCERVTLLTRTTPSDSLHSLPMLMFPLFTRKCEESLPVHALVFTLLCQVRNSFPKALAAGYRLAEGRDTPSERSFCPVFANFKEGAPEQEL